jgi:hypothetical protein
MSISAKPPKISCGKAFLHLLASIIDLFSYNTATNGQLKPLYAVIRDVK